MSLFWKMIYHHSVLRDIWNDFLFDFGQIVRYLKPKPNLQSNYELTKVKKYTWVVFLRILEQIWNPFSFKSFSLFHTRLSLEAFVLYNYVTVVCEWGHIGYYFYKGKPRRISQNLIRFLPRIHGPSSSVVVYWSSHLLLVQLRSEMNRTNCYLIAKVMLVILWTLSPTS